MSSIRLKHASGNSMSLAAPGTNPASNLELKLPHTIGSANQLLKVDGSGQLGWATDSTTDSTKLPLAGGTLTGTLNIGNGSITTGSNFSLNGNALTVTGSSGTVIEGKRAGSATIQATNTTDSTDLQLRADSTGGLVRTASNTPLVLGTNQQERLRLDSNGEVLIGATARGREKGLHLAGANQDPTGVWTQMGIYSTDSQAAGKGGSIGFGGQDGSLAKQQFAAIKGAKENGTSGNYAGYMSFYTRPNGAVTQERLRIKSDGSIRVDGPTAATHGLRFTPNGWNGYDNRMGYCGTSGADFWWSSNWNPTDGSRDHSGYATNYIRQNISSGYLSFGTGAVNTSASERLRIDSGGNFIVGGTAVGNAGSFGIQPTGHVRTVLTSGSGTGDTLFGAISGVSNGFQINVDSSNNQEYRFHNGSSRTVSIKASGVTEFGANGNWGANPRTVSIGSRTQNIFAPLAIARGEALGGGTGPLMEFIHGPDSGTQRIHQLYSYVGDFRIFADANENMELRGANIIMKDGNSNEKARLDSNGNLLIGRTSAGNTGNGHTLRSSDSCIFSRNATGETVQISRNSNNGQLIQFRTGDSGNATEIGNISKNGGSSVAYNTTSDYRLKENEVAISDGITRLKILKPYRFNFKTEPSKTVDGFFAHEVTPSVPEAITGEKDGTEMQGIDQSKLVPLLTAALKEAITKIETLETKVAALEAG